MTTKKNCLQFREMFLVGLLIICTSISSQSKLNFNDNYSVYFTSTTDFEKSVAAKNSDYELGYINRFEKLTTNTESGEGRIKIEKLSFKRSDTTSVEIQYKKPNGKLIKETIKINQEFPSGTLFIVPTKTEVVLQTIPNNNKQILRPGSKHLATVTEDGEEHRTFWGKVRHFKNKVKNRIGSIFSYNTTGGNKRFQAAAKSTEWTVEVDSFDTKFERFSGKVAVSLRNKIELNEELGAASEELRELFDSEITFLNSEKTVKSFKLNDDQSKKLITEAGIDKFFKDQIRKQRKYLSKSGPNSKKAFKLIELDQDSLGILKYQEAITSGEVERDVLIQSSLLLAEAYFRNDRIKSIESWLDTALYFNELENVHNQEQYDEFSSLNENDIEKSFINDLILSNEYFAWAFSVKLKFKSCLEAPDQNPIVWRDNANRLRSILEDL